MPHAGYFFENFVNLFKIAGHHWTSAAQNIFFPLVIMIRE